MKQNIFKVALNLWSTQLLNLLQASYPVILNTRRYSEVATAGLTPKSNDLRRQIVHFQLRFFRTLPYCLYIPLFCSFWLKS